MIGECDTEPLRNSFSQRDDPPRCGNCEQMERRINEIQEQLDEMEARENARQQHEYL
jgi:hypothetical protein